MYIGVDIGGSKILVVSSNNGTEIAGSERFETPTTPEQSIVEIIHAAEKLADKSQIKSIQIAVAGPVDKKAGILLSCPNIPWNKNTNLVKPLKDHFAIPVALENDANAAALSEAVVGAGNGAKHVLYITISTGVNATLVNNGEVYTGAYGAESGHMVVDPDGPECGCGGKGHWEAIASGQALKKRHGKYGYEIEEGSPIWEEYAGDVAVGLHNLITVLSPSTVVMGGGVNVHFHKFEKHLMKHLEELKPLYPLPPIVPAKNIETAVAYGALILASRLSK